jgi:hypothetical protein
MTGTQLKIHIAISNGQIRLPIACSNRASTLTQCSFQSVHPGGHSDVRNIAITAKIIYLLDATFSQ